MTQLDMFAAASEAPHAAAIIDRKLAVAALRFVADMEASSMLCRTAWAMRFDAKKGGWNAKECDIRDLRACWWCPSIALFLIGERLGLPDEVSEQWARWVVDEIRTQRPSVEPLVEGEDPFDLIAWFFDKELAGHPSPFREIAELFRAAADWLENGREHGPSLPPPTQEEIDRRHWRAKYISAALTIQRHQDRFSIWLCDLMSTKWHSGWGLVEAMSTTKRGELIVDEWASDQILKALENSGWIKRQAWNCKRRAFIPSDPVTKRKNGRLVTEVPSEAARAYDFDWSPSYALVRLAARRGIDGAADIVARSLLRNIEISGTDRPRGMTMFQLIQAEEARSASVA